MGQKKLIVPNVLITGGTSGLGYELAKCFINKGFEVFVTGRNNMLLKSLGDHVHFVKIDLSDFTEVLKGAGQLLELAGRFDIIINNAGILSPSNYTSTSDGFELTFQVNFLSQLLLDILIIRGKPDKGTITVACVTSPVFRFFNPHFKAPERTNYHAFRTYAESKIYLLLAGGYLKELYPGKNIRYLGLDPGTFSSGIYRMQKMWFHILYKIAAPFMRKPERIASYFADILTNNDYTDGAILKSYGKTENLNYLDNEAAGIFMKRCYKIIEPLL